ncbi:MAG TPA: glycosyltransferase family 2 protein [Marmoricola sp.]|nr:glycosyltransferase family 2 protein [Marmoricola sp.]
MIFTVSTVKDSLANVAAFCQRNLGSGADHLFIFLDGPDAEVEAYLAAHPQVTMVVTDSAYWTPSRPQSLNVRQVTNANLAMHALAALPGEHWLFHIDADEVVQIDREQFDQLQAGIRVARLAPLEAISQFTWPGEVTHFKRMLARPQINELVSAGIIDQPEPDEPANATYFRGHVQGKVGVRPNLDIRMQLHRAVFTTQSGDDEVIKPFDAPWLNQLHYESHSGEEFVRKWMAHLGAGEVRFRARRNRLSDRIRAVMADPGLDEAGRREQLRELYHEQIEDDFNSLLQRDLLVEPMPRTHQPASLPSAESELLAGVLALLVASDKRYANPQESQLWPQDGFAELVDSAPNDEVRRGLQRAIEAAEDSQSARGLVRRTAVNRRTGLLSRLRRK